MQNISSQMLKQKTDDSKTELWQMRFKSASQMKTEIFILFSDSCQTLIQKHIKMSAEVTVLISITLEMVLMKYKYILSHVNYDKESVKVRWSDFSVRMWWYWFCVISDNDSSALSDRVWVTVLMTDDWRALRDGRQILYQDC